jgi:MoaA/NifB/PqqE/SkfB family radical SAM enzyme
MAAIAGSKGRIEEKGAAGRRPWRVALAEALLSGHSSVEEALDLLRTHARLREISVETNMQCNLRCSYCYLAQRSTTNTLPLHIWKARLREAALEGVSLIAIVGKEPFIDASGPELLAFLDELRRQHHLQFRSGTVTNGTLLERHIEALASIDRIDYLDISLDGLGPRHDEIRGRGSFAKAMRGFRAAKDLPNLHSLFVNTTVHRRNLDSVPEFIAGMVDLGVVNMHFSPVLNFTADPTVEALLLSSVQIKRLVYELGELSDWVPGQTVFELPTQYVWHFLGDDLFSFEHIKEDANGVLFVRPDPAKRFYLKTVVFPGHFWSSARISHEGLYLGELDTVAWALPEYALGNIMHQSIMDIFATALEKGGWFERYYRYTLGRLLILARRGGLTAGEFQLPDAWRRPPLHEATVPALQQA